MHYSDSSLRAVRNHFGLSQADLAQYLGIDRSLLTHVEADRRSLPMAATWRLLPLLGLMPPPHGTAPAGPLPPDPAEVTAATLNALQKRLRACRHEAKNLEYDLENQLPRLEAARHRRSLPARLAALPPRAPLAALPNEAATPDLAWAARMAESAVPDLARFGVPARALLEARLIGLKAETAYLEEALGGTGH
ncbi:helix-turn-helix transcriptional regulator [Hymenobacter negativus]|uniref:Helix-turn-helix transcriptional regulator n=1 Tax=Hymenobacter negativus TaxID=2795026 RepID=A0ABS3QEJ8_9BACT|nr:helix-turn-helix transcriptional regulator [Hymenobacter negativus]MBO2009145.1 helix-turn-helix transcriptional regulator [Hymenobacter negativus]